VRFVFIVKGMHAGSGPLHPVGHRAPRFLLWDHVTRTTQEVKRLGRFFQKKCVKVNVIGAGGVYLSLPWTDGRVKKKVRQSALPLKELVQVPVPYPRRFIGCSALLVSARTVPWNTYRIPYLAARSTDF
jgi:hypothetical protein